MARYAKMIISQKSPEEIMNAAHYFLISNGFVKKTYSKTGETVYQKSSGWISAPKYIKLERQGENVIIEAWFRYVILPYIYVGEFDISDGSFVGVIPKKEMRKLVSQMEAQVQ